MAAVSLPCTLHLFILLNYKVKDHQDFHSIRRYYRSVPPVAKTLAIACVVVTGAQVLDLYSPRTIALSYEDVFRRFQVWRLITNFFYLGPYSVVYSFHLLLILRYGVSLERGPFNKRTADYIWMFIFGACSLLLMAAIPILRLQFLSVSMAFMIVYVWGRNFPNDLVHIHGFIEVKGIYVPWHMLLVDWLLKNPLKPDLLGIAAGHLYYFLTVIHPLAGGRSLCTTPFWVHKLVAIWESDH